MKHTFVGLIMMGLMIPAYSQSVTVGTTGAMYTNLTSALLSFTNTATNSDGTTNTITFLDDGPFIEFNRIIINEARAGTDDLVIQGAPGVRPVIIADLNASASKVSMIHLRKIGVAIVKDLIIIPPKDNITDQASYLSRVGEAGLEVILSSTGSTSITLENILVSSNDGTNNPIASLDGLTSPTFTPATISFRDEGILVQSNTSPHLQHLEMNQLVVSGVSGDQGSDAVRGFPDGADGSQWIIGPGSVFSYNNTTAPPVPPTTGNGAFQPGGTVGFEIHVRGTEDNPVKFINNNLSGISLSEQAGALFLTTMEWCIIANNTGVGIKIGDLDTDLDLSNITLANNASGILLSPPNPDSGHISLSNVIAAGNGNASDPLNIINLAPAAFVNPSNFNVNDSAIVLNGPYTANNTGFGNDGINSNSAYVVTPVNITNSNPAFASLDPSHTAFAEVTNSDYLTAGPGGGPLVGGGSIATSVVSDWQVY